jgi:molybdopterin-synthase adenylyltransferase
MERYSRQLVLPQIGPEGQKKIESMRVAIVGMGALGTVSAQLCARAGVGFLKLIDRDTVELSNLQRQVLFDEDDARNGKSKARAAADHLQKINSAVRVEPVVEDLRFENARDLLGQADAVLDGTDNFETRYLLNDFCLQNRIPFVYGGAVETRGMVYSVLPDGRPCLRCLFPQPPNSAHIQTCDRGGILASASHWTAAVQFSEMIRARVEGFSAVPAVLNQYDVWKGGVKQFEANRLVSERCLGCREEKYLALESGQGVQTVKLCGRNAVQIQPEEGEVGRAWDFIKKNKEGHFPVRVYADFARMNFEQYELTLFQSGRVIVKGTEDPAVARSVYARWIGC